MVLCVEADGGGLEMERAVANIWVRGERVRAATSSTQLQGEGGRSGKERERNGWRECRMSDGAQSTSHSIVMDTCAILRLSDQDSSTFFMALNVPCPFLFFFLSFPSYCLHRLNPNFCTTFCTTAASGEN